MNSNDNTVFSLNENDNNQETLIMTDDKTEAIQSPIEDPLLVDHDETVQYKPIDYHWFYTTSLNEKLIWQPMSLKDSASLEKIYLTNIVHIKSLRVKSEKERIDYLKKNPINYVINIKGGRFEVDLIELIKRPIYWDDKNTSQVKRCLWFFKESNEQRFIPFDEEYSEFLEKWSDGARNTPAKKSHSFNEDDKSKQEKENSLTSDEAFVFHSTGIMLHFTQATMLDEFGNLNSDAMRPRIVKRGLAEVAEKVEPDETEKIDHLCFVVHGIGEGCDLKFRPIEDCVDDFRDLSAYITQSHMKNLIDSGEISGRVEFLPISWHRELHGDPTGVDERVKPITLSSIPKLREYSNSTILDVLFYTSPIYCQTIISKVSTELNRLHKIFVDRNPNFTGKVSLVGHSLGSLIVFDLLSHQFDANTQQNEKSSKSDSHNENLEHFLTQLNMLELKSVFDKEKIDINNIGLLNEEDLINLGIPMGQRKVLLEQFKNKQFKKEQKEIEKKIQSKLETLGSTDLNLASSSQNYFKYGLAGTGQLVVKYPQLNFKVENFFALGSPISIFLTVRGIEKLGTEFKFPTCKSFFNIFHPFDPIAYRFEPLISPNLLLKPVLMPHHKGRKRLHLELRENFTKVSEDLKQKMYGQFKSAWSSISEFAKLPKVLSANSMTNNETVRIVEGSNEALISKSSSTESMILESKTDVLELNVKKEDQEAELSNEEKLKVDFGKINKGRRIDYVLQERPIESFNEYLFALASHACYWESEDTILLIVKEMYGHGNTVDSNTELQLTEQQQQQQSSWFTQAASSAFSANVQKTMSYFSLGFPQSLTSVLNSTINSTSSNKPTTTTQKTEENKK